MDPTDGATIETRNGLCQCHMWMTDTRESTSHYRLRRRSLLRYYSNTSSTS